MRSHLARILFVSVLAFTAACGGGSGSDKAEPASEPVVNPDYNSCVANAATPADASKCVPVRK